MRTTTVRFLHNTQSSFGNIFMRLEARCKLHVCRFGLCGKVLQSCWNFFVAINFFNVMAVRFGMSDDYLDWKRRPARTSKNGGMRGAGFVFVAEVLENMTFISNATNLVTYFSAFMHYSLAESANMLTNFMGTAFLLTLLGGFVSDSFITRFWTIICFGSAELLGLLMLTLQAHFPSLKPPPCSAKKAAMKRCKHPLGGQAAMLFIGLYTVALGTGGVKASLPAHGADQFDDTDPIQRKLRSKFFNWFFFSLCVGGLLAVTIVVWIQENIGWQWGFGISTGGIFFSLLIIILGLPLYRNKIPSGSPLTRMAQVLVAAVRNRHLALPSDAKMLYNACIRESPRTPHYGCIQHTDQFRFLDKAAIVEDGNFAEAESTSHWRLCPVKQIEEIKSVLRVLPIFATTIMMNCCLAQLQTFSVQQGRTMDTTLNTFKIPTASLTAIPLVFMVILVPLYDQLFVPVARRITGHERGITHLQRVGVGLVLSAVAMAVAAAVEVKRKAVARDRGMAGATEAALPISVLWLGWQYLVLGIADMFTLAGLMEFFYSEAPSGMRSLSTALSWCSTSLGYFLSSVLVSVVNRVSARFGDGVGWLSGNDLNRSHLELFYCLLCGLTSLNFFHYLLWARWYNYKP